MWLDLDDLPLTYQAILNVTEALSKLCSSLSNVTTDRREAAPPYHLTSDWAWKLGNVGVTLEEIKTTLDMPLK